MKSFFYVIIFLFLSYFLMYLGLSYTKTFLVIEKNKDDLWEETLYYGSNKAYFKTLDESNIDDFLNLDNLYSFEGTDELGNSIEPFSQLSEELIKDITVYLSSNNKQSFKIAGVQGDGTDKTNECFLSSSKPVYSLFDIYISRKEMEEEEFNTVKISLCPRRGV